MSQIEPEAQGRDGSAELAHARVAAQLRHGLMSGRYEPGEVMTLRKLAAQFDMSPMPIRDALRQLVAERALVVVNANRSVAVPLHDKQRLTDIRRVRLTLEGMAAELAAENATDEHLRLIERALVASEEGGAVPDLARNRDFHFAIYAASGSEVLLPMIESLWLQFGPYLRRATELVGTSLGTGDQHHREVVNAIVAGNAAQARQAMMDDISRAMDLLLDDFDAEPGPSTRREVGQ